MNDIYYVFDGIKNKVEGMSKEQVLNAIAEATGATPASVDDAFITTIKETNRNRSLHIWKGTQAQYNALQTIDNDTFYIIEDDTTIDDLQANVDVIEAQVAGLTEYLDRIKITEQQTISSWTSNGSGNDYYTAGYRYKANITVTGCTSNHTGEVIFNVRTAAVGNVAPEFETGTNQITIYSKTNETAYIDRIEVWR